MYHNRWMRRLGLIGGTSWFSTQEYYRQLNSLVNERLGGLNSCECVIDSLNFALVASNINANRFTENESLVLSAGYRLLGARCEAVMICSNTLHQFSPALIANVKLPVLEIPVAVTQAVVATGLKRVAILGTESTMKGSFLSRPLEEQGIRCMVPNVEDRAFIHNSIFNELTKGVFREETRDAYVTVAQRLIDAGAEGIVLACTEIPMLISSSDLSVPVFDTTAIHVRSAVTFALDS